MGQSAVDLPDDPLHPPAPTASADDLLAQMAGEEIDRLLAESESDGPAPPAAVPVELKRATDFDVAPASAPTAAPIPAVVHPPAPVEPVAVTELSSVLTEVAEHPPELFSADTDLDLGPEPRFWFLIRPLAFLSSPLNSMPDSVRELIGKIGIVTALNAAAILAYTMVTRRHH